jgi:DivIVA domain-containing protein
VLTALFYVIVIACVGAGLFFLASAVFGRGEELPALPPGTTLTQLPVDDITGADIRALRFQQVVRGYKQSEVDWALEMLADEIDLLREQLREATARTSAGDAEPR